MVWEAGFYFSRFALDLLVRRDGFLEPSGKTNAQKIVLEGPSYVVAFVHACITGSLGLWHTLSLLDAPLETQLVIPQDTSQLHYAAATATERTNLVLLSWLIYDLRHVLTSYPKLGGMDTVAHHVGFMASSIICGVYRMLPFPFGWLITGELSSVALNIRSAPRHRPMRACVRAPSRAASRAPCTHPRAPLSSWPLASGALLSGALSSGGLSLLAGGF